MSRKAGTVEEYKFTVGSLTAVGSFLDVYTSHPINGTVQSISVGSNNFVNIGSLAFYLNKQGGLLQLFQFLLNCFVLFLE